jgi:hypothetical protein
MPAAGIGASDHSSVTIRECGPSVLRDDGSDALDGRAGQRALEVIAEKVGAWERELRRLKEIQKFG